MPSGSIGRCVGLAFVAKPKSALGRDRPFTVEDGGTGNRTFGGAWRRCTQAPFLYHRARSIPERIPSELDQLSAGFV
jgi:hypothetical protein